MSDAKLEMGKWFLREMGYGDLIGRPVDVRIGEGIITVNPAESFVLNELCWKGIAAAIRMINTLPEGDPMRLQHEQGLRSRAADMLGPRPNP